MQSESTTTTADRRKLAALLLTPILAIVGFVVLSLLLSEPEPPPLPDLSDAQPDERRAAFFAYLLPFVDEQNDIHADRRALLLRIKQRLDQGGNIGFWQRRHLAEIAPMYRIDTSSEDWEEILALALKRVDQLPTSLVLAQAAKESGWGTSRFAQEANNLFGEWCFVPGCGLVPRARGAGRRHEVRSFDSVAGSVRSYFLNLNSHEQYRDLRLMRQALRENDEPLDGVELADGLLYYSERRQAYVNEIKALIRQNDLLSLDYPDDQEGVLEQSTH